MFRSEFLTGLGGSAVVAQIAPYTQTVVLGLVAPLSGNSRDLGNQLVLGAQAAITDTNELRGSFDRAFALRTFDDQNAVASALLQSSFAAADSSIVATIGHVSSDATLQAIPNYAAAQMPLIVPLSTDDRITQTNYRDVFRLPTKDSTEGALFATAARAQYKPKAPFVFVQDADYGADVANGFLTSMHQAGITTSYIQFPWNKPDFATVVEKGLAVTPDYVFLAGTLIDMGGIVPVLRAKGYTGPIGASQGFFDPGTLRLGAPAADMMISSSMPYLQLAPSTLHVRTTYEARNGPLTPIAAFGYAAAQIIISAVQRTNATARNTVLIALNAGSTFSTIVGDYSFLPTGDALEPEIYFYTVRNGAFAYLHQAHPSQFMLK